MQIGDAWKSLLRRAKPPPARVPDGVRVYAVGDVHGCIDLLDQTLARIDRYRDAEPAASEIEVFLGDYVDRGAHSREVIDRLIERSRSRTAVCLMGNHELYLTEFLDDPAIFDDWKQFGGIATLRSYGLPVAAASAEVAADFATALRAALPASHRDFLQSLKPSFTCGDYFFVHAGVRPGIPLAEQRVEDLLWIRQEFLGYDGDFGKVIVHGHTPVSTPDVRPNRINIDTGAYSTGQLTCLVLEADQLSFI